MKQASPPTLSDVAQRAGVSVATASRALSNPDLVAEDTRRIVREAAEACGYRINLLARSLRMRRTDTVLALIPGIDNDFYPEIISGMEKYAHDQGFAIILGLTSNDIDREHSYYQLLGAQRADGLVILDGGIDKLIENGLKPDVPVVQVLECTGGPSMPSVLIDEHEVAERAVAHLHDLGHRRIGHITGSSNSMVSWERVNGFHAAMQRRGLLVCNEMIVSGNYVFDDGESAMMRLLTLNVPPTAVFCANDASAAGAIRACRAAGRRVPHEVSIIGIDDTPLSCKCDPPLTTIRQPRKKIGETAMQIVISLIRGHRDVATRVVMPTELVVRGSTAPAPN